jgi:predicted DNA-binding protein
VSDRTLELMLKAARLLPAAEQDELLLALISGTALRRDGEPPDAGHALDAGAPADAATVPVAQHLAVSRWHLDRAVRRQPLGARDAGDDPSLKVLPVRLPAADYERLRAFSRQHGFSMAVIIRTLVERFLDGQARRSAAAADDEELDEAAVGHA